MEVLLPAPIPERENLTKLQEVYASKYRAPSPERMSYLETLPAQELIGEAANCRVLDELYAMNFLALEQHVCALELQDTQAAAEYGEAVTAIARTVNTQQTVAVVARALLNREQRTVIYC